MRFKGSHTIGAIKRGGRGPRALKGRQQFTLGEGEKRRCSVKKFCPVVWRNLSGEKFLVIASSLCSPFWITFRSTCQRGIFWGNILLLFRENPWTSLSGVWKGWQICKSFVRGQPPRCGVMMSMDGSGDVRAHLDFTKGSRCSLTRAGVQVVRKTAFYFYIHPDFALNALWVLPMAGKQLVLLALLLLIWMSLFRTLSVPSSFD